MTTSGEDLTRRLLIATPDWAVGKVDEEKMAKAEEITLCNVRALGEEVGIKTLVNSKSRSGRTALHIMSLYDMVQSAHQLAACVISVDENRGVDVNKKDMFGLTALCISPSPRMIQALIQMGAKVNTRDSSGVSPLAQRHRSLMTTNALLDAGALARFGSLNPLALPSRAGNINKVKAILARRGFLRVIEWRDDLIGKTPREHAVTEGHSGIVALLDEALALARVWDRRSAVIRAAFCAVDAREALEQRQKRKRNGKKSKRH